MSADGWHGVTALAQRKRKENQVGRKLCGIGKISLVLDCELVDDVEVFNHVAEFIEGDLAVEVLVGLDDGTIDQLLQLHVIQVVADHHLEHLEELAVADEAVVVDVVDLEGEAQLLLGAGAGGERVQSLHELEEADVSVIVAIEHGDDALDKWVVRQLRDLEELGGLKRTTLVPVDLAEVLVELLELLLVKVQILQLLLLLLQLVAHLSRLNY